MTVRSRPPGPVSYLSINHAIHMRRNMVGYLHRIQRQYGDLSYIRVAMRHLYILCDPALIQDVLIADHRLFRKSYALQMAKRILGEGLLTSEGESHRRQRRLIQPAFHRQRIHAYGDIMVGYADRMARHWHHGETVDVAGEMMKVTLSIVAKTLFDAEVESEADEIGEAVTDVLEMFLRVTTPFAEFVNRLPLPSNRRFEQAKARLDSTIYRVIRERRALGVDRGDLLSILLSAQDEDDGTVMSDQQVRDEAITLFLAGHETTAIALTWAWYLLATHPEAEARLHEELDEVLGGRLPTVDDMPRLEYARRVFTEAMRLYPPVYTLGREALEPYQLGDYLVPRGAMIIIPQYVVHRNPKYYEQPEAFMPERWTPEMQESLPRFAYFPFGGGPRVCAGENFAWMEGILLLAVVAQRWRLTLAPGQTGDMRALITLRPKNGMRMVLHKR